MQQCKVFDCLTNSQDHRRLANDSVSFYKLPRDSYFRRIWLENCGRDGETNTDNFYVCDLHFCKDDFDVNYYDKKKLKVCAVPTKNLTNNSDHLYMSSLEAIDGSTVGPNDENHPESSISENSYNEKDLAKQYRHLQLEFEILQDQVKERESTLVALKNENALLNELLGKVPAGV